jgi:hypothetical protein
MCRFLNALFAMRNLCLFNRFLFNNINNITCKNYQYIVIRKNMGQYIISHVEVKINNKKSLFYCVMLFDIFDHFIK